MGPRDRMLYTPSLLPPHKPVVHNLFFDRGLKLRFRVMFEELEARKSSNMTRNRPHINMDIDTGDIQGGANKVFVGRGLCIIAMDEPLALNITSRH